MKKTDLKTVMIVTGSSRGIGLFLANHYLKKGYAVAGCSRGAAGTKHPDYIHYELDVSDEKAVVRMVRDVVKKHGRIDILLNNAGMASMNLLLTTPVSTFDSLVGTNFKSSFLFTREAGKYMSRSRYGRIVNFSSIAAAIGIELESVYAASKKAVESLTVTSSRELAGAGITVNCIGPTPVATAMMKNVPPANVDYVMQYQSIKRFATFEEIAHCVDFFIDERSAFITGQVLYLGGVSA